MCGTPDYGSLVLMAERMFIFGLAATSIATSYFFLSRVRNRDLMKMDRVVTRLVSYFRFK